MHVEFNPVRGLCVVLPPGATFVIAHSLAVSNKAETAPKRWVSSRRDRVVQGMSTISSGSFQGGDSAQDSAKAVVQQGPHLCCLHEWIESRPRPIVSRW